MKRYLSLLLALVLMLGCVSALTFGVHAEETLKAQAFIVNDGSENTDVYVVFNEKITDFTDATLYNRYVNGELITIDLTDPVQVSEKVLKYTIAGATGYITDWRFQQVSGTLHYVASPAAGEDTLPLSDTVDFRGGMTGWATVSKECYTVSYTVVTSADDVPTAYAEAEPEPEPEALTAVAYTVDGDANSVYVVFSHAVPADKAGFVWITDPGSFNADQVTQISEKVIKYTSAYDVAGALGNGAKVGFIGTWGNPVVDGAVLTATDTVTMWGSARSDFYILSVTAVASADEVPAEIPEAEPDELTAVGYTVTGDANSVYVVFSHAVPADKAGFVWITDPGSFNADQVTQISDKVIKYTSAYDIAAAVGNGASVGFHKAWGEPEIDEAVLKTFTNVSMWGSSHDLYVVALTEVASADDVPSEIPEPEPEALTAVAYTVDGDANSVYVVFSHAVPADKAGFVWITDPGSFNADTVTQISEKVIKYTSAYDIAGALGNGASVGFIGTWGNPVVDGTVLTATDTVTMWGSARSDFYILSVTAVASADEIPSEIPEPTGELVEIDGVTYYQVGGTGVMAGLVEVDGDLYFAGYNGKIVTNKLQNIWANATDDSSLTGKNRAFGADGKLLTGILNDVYYKDGVATTAGLVEVDGDYYFAGGAGAIVKNKLQYIWANATDDASLTGKNRAFGADGKLLTGILNDVYYEDGVAKMAGLVEVDGDCYFAGGAGVIVKDKVQYIWMNSTDNTELTETNQTFGADGRMVA